MSYEGYNENYEKKGFTFPYTYELKKGNKKFICLGSSHSNDPESPEFKLFKKEFIKLKPQVIFVEGNHEKVDWLDKCKSEEYAIKIDEMAFLSYIAQKKKIPVLSWEPGEVAEIKILDKKFSRKNIFAHYMLRLIGQYIQIGKPKDYFEFAIKEFEKLTKWRGFDYSFENLKKIHKELFGFNLTLSKSKVQLYSLPPFPIKNDSVLNKIAAESSKLRDKHAVKVILKSFKKYDRVLAIMGGSHAIMQEPVYREYFD